VRGLLRWLLPAGFRGQVAGILLLGLLLSQLIAAILYMVLVPQWERVLRPELAVSKVAMVVQLLESVAPSERPRFASLWNDPDFRIHYAGSQQTLEDSSAHTGADAELRAQLATKLARPLASVRVHELAAPHARNAKSIEVQLRDGDTVDVVASVGLEHRLGFLEQVAIVAFLAFATAGLWAWLTWMVNAPLTRFARAAESVGLDVQAPPLPERGPAQLKRAIHAFNEMQVRLQRFLSDRTRMLGAISHDLRTPLTRLRLRIETDRVAEDKAKMLADIEGMETMLSSALAFIRGVEEVDTPDIVDIDSLLQTICDGVSDLGREVSYSGPARCRYHCKPQAMLRALTNIVTNAAKYGVRATVTLTRLPGSGYVIEVQDEGPGISDEEKAKVFEPFYRSPATRDMDSQGMGLGLAIARSIILAHGGTIELRDREPQGLTVRVFLPESSGTPSHA
jgi:signal transduction histidine kinase